MSRRPATFRIVFQIGASEYGVIPLQPHPDVAAKAYRLRKRGPEPVSYDVRQTDAGTFCECRGFLRWGTPCKHIRALVAAGMLDALQPGTAAG
jgi:hypothetical protein